MDDTKLNTLADLYILVEMKVLLQRFNGTTSHNQAHYLAVAFVEGQIDGYRRNANTIYKINVKVHLSTGNLYLDRTNNQTCRFMSRRQLVLSQAKYSFKMTHLITQRSCRLQQLVRFVDFIRPQEASSRLLYLLFFELHRVIDHLATYTWSFYQFWID